MLWEHQKKAGQNIIQGLTTIYNVPTGGGKTLALTCKLIVLMSPSPMQSQMYHYPFVSFNIWFTLMWTSSFSFPQGQMIITSLLFSHQTVIYVNKQKEAKEIQDFLCDHCPSSMSPNMFEFYHRNITENQKELIQERLRSGYIQCVIATDVLGMVCAFFLYNLSSLISL